MCMCCQLLKREAARKKNMPYVAQMAEPRSLGAETRCRKTIICAYFAVGVTGPSLGKQAPQTNLQTQTSVE
jgi:hypothetical protein